MTTNVELYEALRDRIGEEAARMIAESVPPARELATRADVGASESALRRDLVDMRDGLRGEMGTLRNELRGEMGTLRDEFRVEMATLRDEVRADMSGLREDMAAMRGELLAAIKGTEAGLMRWMLTFFAPLWLGVWGTLVVIVLTR